MFSSLLCVLWWFNSRTGKLILSAAVRNRLPHEELSETLYFISDMEYDCCTGHAELANLNTRKSCLKIMAIRCRKCSSGTSEPEPAAACQHE